jgi:hypothetical protein
MIGDTKPLIRRESRDILNGNGHTIGPIGHARRQTDENQCGHSKHCPTARDGIDEPSGESARNEQNEVKK